MCAGTAHINELPFSLSLCANHKGREGRCSYGEMWKWSWLMPPVLGPPLLPPPPPIFRTTGVGAETRGRIKEAARRIVFIMPLYATMSSKLSRFCCCFVDFQIWGKLPKFTVKVLFPSIFLRFFSEVFCCFFLSSFLFFTSYHRRHTSSSQTEYHYQRC